MLKVKVKVNTKKKTVEIEGGVMSYQEASMFVFNLTRVLNNL